MVVEYLVLAFLMSFMTCGVAVPVLAWAGMIEWRRRKLCAELSHRGVAQLTDMAGPSADVPLSLAFAYRDQSMRVDAVVRGEHELWHLRLPLPVPLPVTLQAPTPRGEGSPGGRALRVALVERAWGRPLPLARAWSAHAAPAAWGEERWEFRADNARDLDALGPRLQRAMASLGSGRAHLRQVVIDDDALWLEVDRAGLESAALAPWLDRILAFADALGVERQRSLPPAPPPSDAMRGIHPLSGNPLGVPGG